MGMVLAQMHYTKDEHSQCFRLGHVYQRVKCVTRIFSAIILLSFV
jgi:hypothetical protein